MTQGKQERRSNTKTSDDAGEGERRKREEDVVSVRWQWVVDGSVLSGAVEWCVAEISHSRHRTTATTRSAITKTEEGRGTGSIYCRICFLRMNLH